jgi:tRNA U34 5-methylaminomethyl-2-thiouridine-forming methyltransferase MnmC
MEINQMQAPGSKADALQFITTADGSKTIYHTRVGEHYHSTNGAVQESTHVFLESGLKHFLKESGSAKVSVLEVGFGTGLNFLLSAAYCQASQVVLQYSSIEAYPLALDMIRETGYQEYAGPEIWNWYTAAYERALREEMSFPPFVQLEIIHQKLQDFDTGKQFDVLYFDAFAARNQPEMWTAETLEQVCRFLSAGGFFVTYAMNGNLKRNLEALGFRVERLAGAAGKREMLRATKKKLPPAEGNW